MNILYPVYYIQTNILNSILLYNIIDSKIQQLYDDPGSLYDIEDIEGLYQINMHI